MRTHLDVGLDLLDRQIVDCDGHPVGKVDDLELDLEAGAVADREAPAVTAVLVGPEAWGRRLESRLGQWVSGAARRLGADPVVIPIELVAEFGVELHLSVSIRELAGTDRLEHWLRDHFIRRIPGGRHATE